MITGMPSGGGSFLWLYGAFPGSKLCLFGSVRLLCGDDWIFSSSLPMAFGCLVQARHLVDLLKVLEFPFPKIR